MKLQNIFRTKKFIILSNFLKLVKKSWKLMSLSHWLSFMSSMINQEILESWCLLHIHEIINIWHSKRKKKVALKKEINKNSINMALQIFTLLLTWTLRRFLQKITYLNHVIYKSVLGKTFYHSATFRLK